MNAAGGERKHADLKYGTPERGNGYFPSSAAKDNPAGTGHIYDGLFVFRFHRCLAGKIALLNGGTHHRSTRTAGANLSLFLTRIFTCTFPPASGSELRV